VQMCSLQHRAGRRIWHWWCSFDIWLATVRATLREGGRQAGREKLSGSRAVLLLLQLGRREIDDRPSQCHYTLPPSSTSSTSSGAPVPCAPSAAPTPSILDTLINTRRRVELSRLCLPECICTRAPVYQSLFITLCVALEQQFCQRPVT
jgi:hypothetical protein